LGSGRKIYIFSLSVGGNSCFPDTKSKRYRSIIIIPSFQPIGTPTYIYKLKEKRHQTSVIKYLQKLTVLRIRDFYPGSDFFPSRILDPNCLHPGSRILIKEFKYFNPKKSNKILKGGVRRGGGKGGEREE
jgi:hypothetical protein